MERHFNDKHCAEPVMFKCEDKHCTYQSKRESNCKQHMEKAHGRPYDRSKGAAKRRQASVTPSSNMTSLPTPATGSSLSPSRLSLRSSQEPPFSFAEPPLPTGHWDAPLFPDRGFPQNSSNTPFPTTFDTFQNQFGPTDSNTLMPTLGMDRQSMDSSSLPELVGTTMGADGSSVASADNDFESCWSNVQVPNQRGVVRHAAEQSVTTNMHTVSPTRAESMNGMASSSQDPSLSSTSPISNQHSGVPGLSPGVPGDAMLLDADSLDPDNLCAYGQGKSSNDFLSYENTTDFGVTQPSTIPGLRGMDPMFSSVDFSDDLMGDGTNFPSNMDFSS